MQCIRPLVGPLVALVMSSVSGSLMKQAEALMDRLVETIYKGTRIRAYLGSNWVYVYYKDSNMPFVYESLKGAKNAITRNLNRKKGSL
jgi:hypothetical protein